MTPAETVVSAFGGVRPTASVMGICPSTVRRWLFRPGRVTNAGNIPIMYHKKLLEEAHKLCLDLTTEHLIYGRNGSIVRNGSVMIPQFGQMVSILAGA